MSGSAEERTILLGRVTQLELDQVHPVSRTGRQDLVVEVVEREWTFWQPPSPAPPLPIMM